MKNILSIIWKKNEVWKEKNTLISWINRERERQLNVEVHVYVQYRKFQLIWYYHLHATLYLILYFASYLICDWISDVSFIIIPLLFCIDITFLYKYFTEKDLNTKIDVKLYIKCDFFLLLFFHDQYHIHIQCYKVISLFFPLLLSCSPPSLCTHVYRK